MNKHNHKLTPEELDKIREAIEGIIPGDVDAEIEISVVSESDKAHRSDEQVEKILKELEKVAEASHAMADCASRITHHILDAADDMDAPVNRILYGIAHHLFITYTDAEGVAQHVASFLRKRERDD